MKLDANLADVGVSVASSGRGANSSMRSRSYGDEFAHLGVVQGGVGPKKLAAKAVKL